LCIRADQTLKKLSAVKKTKFPMKVDIVIHLKHDIQIAKLIMLFDKLGFGPKDRSEPEILKQFKDTIVDSLHQEVGPWMKQSLVSQSLKPVLEKENKFS